MKKCFKKAVSLLLSVVLTVSLLSIGFVQSYADGTIAVSENHQYKIRLLVFEVETFDSSNKAFGGDSAEYVNYGSEHIGQDEDWCRVDYKSLNGTGDEKSAYITLYDRDGDGRYNVVSAWGSSGGYFPSKNGMLIDGFPTYLYAQYYKTGNSWQGKNGQFRIFLQIASLQNGEWVWSEGTNEEIGDAVMNDSFDSDKQATYGGGVLDLMSTKSGDNVNNVALKAQGAVPTSKFPAAKGNAPSASYAYDILTCPKSGEVNVVNPISLDHIPKDQYGVTMQARVQIEGSVSSSGFEQDNYDTIITANANLRGGEYNSEAYNSQTITTTLTWPQASGTAQSAEVSFRAIDYLCTVFLMDSNGTEIDETDYYYGCVPNLPAAAKAFDESHHYLNAHWDHEAVAVSNTANNTYTLYYDEAEHQYNAYEPFDINYHDAICSVDSGDVHRLREKHDLRVKTYEPTCTKQGYTAYTCSKCSYSYETDFVLAPGHMWDNGVITREPTCAQSGIRTYTCERCGQTKTDSISALTHQPVLHYVAPTDKHNGGVYYACENCGAYWAAVYSRTLQDYDIPDETPLPDAEAALAVSDVLYAPNFNIYTDSDTQYSYESRGASLKLLYSELPNYQPLRFAVSVKVPQGIDEHIGSSGNAIVDAGIIYSQTERIGSIENFEIGKPDVYKMSLLEENAGTVYDGTNWNGVAKREDAAGTHLTFNLVIDVKPVNWAKDYCARGYITYRINGVEFTVYDEAFSSRSVESVARSVAADEQESLQARRYCQSHIIDNLDFFKSL